jgi:hypothetical protein
VARKSKEKRAARDMRGREPTAAAVQSSSMKGRRGSPHPPYGGPSLCPAPMAYQLMNEKRLLRSEAP